MEPRAFLGEWRIGVHNEQPDGFGTGLPGLSYWPNEGPISLSWHGDTINAKIDQHSYHEPLFDDNGGSMWTWMALLKKNIDQPINDLQVSVDMWANSWTPGNSATRAMVALSFTVDGIWYAVEVLVYRDEWEDGSPVINEKWHRDDKWSCQLNGLYWGIQLDPKTWDALTVNWTQILTWLIDGEYIPDVIDRPHTASLAVSHETRSTSASGTGAPVSHIKFRDFQMGKL